MLQTKISIIGFGRFGKTLFRLLKDDFDLVVFDSDKKVFENFDLGLRAKIANNIEEIFESRTVFFCVPISSFEKTIKDTHKLFQKDQLLVDVLSVKMHPEKVFKKWIHGTGAKAMLTHPMFGPDSSKNGFAGLPIVMDKFLSSDEDFAFWKNFFASKGLRIVEISAREHDQLAAKSQSVAHFLGRALGKAGFTPTEIDTKGAVKLEELKQMAINDTQTLFRDLQKFNPYTKRERKKLLASLLSLDKYLLQSD